MNPLPQSQVPLSLNVVISLVENKTKGVDANKEIQQSEMHDSIRSLEFSTLIQCSRLMLYMKFGV